MTATVLVIDDVASVRHEVVRLLAASPAVGEVLQASDGLQGFVLLRKHPVDLVLCDVMMPNVDGFKFLGLVRAQPELADVPVILLTAEGDVQAKVHGLNAGASDYLTKPFDANELAARVRVHLKIKALQDELRQKNAALQALTRTDPLTGLNNRRTLEEGLRNEFLRSERYRTPVVLAMVDIDHFKKVNDTFGHPVGDKALVAVAQALQHTARVQDLVARFGGEEFAVLMPHTDLAGATLAAERHRAAIAAIGPVTPAGPARLSVSIGLCVFPHPEVTTVEAWLARADAALYRAKANGRNCVMAEPDG